MTFYPTFNIPLDLAEIALRNLSEGQILANFCLNEVS